jgi:molybdopterin molybdotransferase
VVTTGGVSVGDYDFVKRAFQSLGGELEFWKIAMRPGKPFVFGRWQDKFLFGLPGNPVSALVTFALLVRPALLQMQGATNVGLTAHPGVLAEPIVNPGDRRHFVRVTVDEAGQVRISGQQASHMLGGLARADALVDVPPGGRLETGATVTVMRLL